MGLDMTIKSKALGILLEPKFFQTSVQMNNQHGLIIITSVDIKFGYNNNMVLLSIGCTSHQILRQR